LQMEQAPAQKFDFGKYVNILLRRKWWGIVPLFVLIPATFVGAALSPKKYQATCMLYIGATPAEEEVSARMNPLRMAQNKLQDIRNRMLDYNNIRELIAGSDTSEPVRGLAEGINVNDEADIEKLYNEILGAVSVNPMGTEYIQVSYRGKTSEIALSVVSELVDKFLDSWIGTVKSGHLEALDRRNDELESLKRRLDQADKNLREFNQRYGREIFTRDPDYLMRTLGIVTTRLNEIGWELEAKARKRQFLKERLQETSATRESLAKYERSLKRRELDRRIAELEIALLLMSDKFTPDHPEVKKRQTQLDLLKEERDKTEDEKTEVTVEPNPVYDRYREDEHNVELEIQVLESERASKTARQTELKEDIHNLPLLREQKSKYEREIEVLRQLYAESNRAKADAQRRFDLARLARINSFQKLTIRSSPKPDYSSALKTVAFGLFATVAVAVAAMVGREYLDQSLTTIDDARDFLRIPSLGVVPMIVTAGDLRRRKRMRWLIAVSVLVLIGAAAAACWKIPVIRDPLANMINMLKSGIERAL